MTIEYTGRQVTIPHALKDQADAALTAMEKLLGPSATAHVILTAEKHRQIAEVTVAMREHSLVATCEATEISVALHDALAKVEQQAVRLRQKTNTTRRHPREAVKPGMISPADETAQGIEPGTL